MRLICPDCQKNFVLPDSDSGKPTACPLCGFHFVAPQIYSPPVAPLPPMQPVADIPAVAADAPSPAPIANPTDRLKAEGYAHSRRLTLSRDRLPTIPGFCLLLVLLVTLLKWVGTWPGGYAGYSQNAWQTVTAGMSRDTVTEKVMKAETLIRTNLHTNWWMLAYLVLLIAAILLTWADEILRLTSRKLPASLEPIRRHRPTIVSVLAVATLSLLVLQCALGFGLENAVRDMIAADATNQEALKAATTPEEIQIAEVTIAMQSARFPLEGTTWLRLAILAHLVAVIALVLEVILRRRGDKPEPGVMVYW